MGIKITPADKWFSLCVRERSNWTCERCGAVHAPPDGGRSGVECSHWQGRGSWSTRFDKDNGFCLCYGCHSYLGSRPGEHNAFARKLLGETLADMIQAKAKKPANGLKKAKKEIAKHYREQFEKMKILRDQGVTGRIEFLAFD